MIKHALGPALVAASQFLGAPDAQNAATPQRPPLSAPAVKSAMHGAATAFVRNVGQWPAGCLFRAQFGAVRCDVHRDGWSVTMPGDKTKAGCPSVLRFRAARERDGVAPIGEGELLVRSNYFFGNDPSRWRTDVVSYATVLLREVSPGIDVRLREDTGRLKYDVLVRKDAELESFAIAVEGADALVVTFDGSLTAQASAGDVRQPSPIAFSGTQSVTCSYRLIGSAAFGFDVHAWDRAADLVIDPALICSTYLGGTGSDVIAGVVVRGSLVTVAGYTNGDFPTTPNAYDRTYNGTEGSYDAFIAQLDVSLSGSAQLVYATYLGSPAADGADAVMVDARGLITIVGGGGQGFPTTPNAYGRTPEGAHDAVVVQLDPRRSGSAQLVYSSFIPTNGAMHVLDATFDNTGRVCFVGSQFGTNLPTTPGAIITDVKTGYVVCLDPRLPPTQQVTYCTYVGGNNFAEVRAIAAKNDGTLVLVGRTDSDAMLMTPGAFQPQLQPLSSDAFVWVLDPTRTGTAQLVYGTYLGGSGHEVFVNDVALDIDGVITVVGETPSPDFPTTPNAFSRRFYYPQGFISRLDPRRSGAAQLLYSTFLGSKWGDAIQDVDTRSGIVTVAGLTDSRDFPTTPGAFARNLAGAADMFVTQLDTVRSRLLYSTLIGGERSDALWCMTMDENGVVAIGGGTISFTYPTTDTAYQRAYAAGGLADACLTVLELQADGLQRFGKSTPGCTGLVLLRGTAMPQMGNVGFGLLSTNTPASSVGALLLGVRPLPSGVVFAGAELLVDPNGGVILPVASSDLRRADLPIPIPSNPGLVGGTIYAQTVWLGATMPSPCPPLGVSASFGLRITVQP
jgi:hypothetical protein